MATRFRCDRTWSFPVPVEDLWQTLVRHEDWTSWWSWLAEFDLHELASGSVGEAVVRSPVGYRLRFAVEVIEVLPGRSVVGTVSGDMAGPARLDVAAARGSLATVASTATLTWDLGLVRGPASLVAKAAPRVAQWGHDRILAAGVRDFEAVLSSVGPVDVG